MIAFLVRREGSVLYIFAVMFYGSAEERGRVSISANKFGGRREGEVEHVVKHENLAIAIRTGAYPDRRNRKLRCNLGGHLARNSFEHHNAGSSLGEGTRIGLELGNCFGGAGLHAVTAHAMHTLWRKAEVAHDRNFSGGESAHKFDARPLDLDRFGACFLHKSDGVGQAL